MATAGAEFRRVSEAYIYGNCPQFKRKASLSTTIISTYNRTYLCILHIPTALLPDLSHCDPSCALQLPVAITPSPKWCLVDAIIAAL